MKVNGFGEYPVNNISSGGKKNSVDEYNKSFKGDAYKHYEEYLGRQVEEYHLYSEYNDFTDKQQDRENDSSQSDKKKQKNARAQRQRMLQQVVGLVAGSVVVVTSYQSVVKQQANAAAETVVQTQDQGTGEQNQYDPSDNTNQEETTSPEETTVPEETTAAQETTAPGETTAAANQNKTAVNGKTNTNPSGYSSSWNWSNGNKTATVTIKDKNGKIIKEVPAKVTVDQKAATCKTEGSIVYTATATDEGRSYSSSKSEKVEALGHSFGEGKEVVLDNGQTAMTFECARCHEKFTIQTSITEND